MRKRLQYQCQQKRSVPIAHTRPHRYHYHYENVKRPKKKTKQPIQTYFRLECVPSEAPRLLPLCYPLRE